MLKILPSKIHQWKKSLGKFMLPHKWNKYFALVYLSIAQSLKNYKVLIGLSIFLIACLLIFSNLWKITSTQAGGVYYTPEQLLWYIAFYEWVFISIPGI